MSKKKYIGEREIESMDVVENLKTPEGSAVHVVTFTNGGTQYVTDKSYNLLVTDQPVDWTSVRKKQIDHILIDILKIIAEHNILVGDVDYLCSEIKATITNTLGRASNFSITGDDSRFVPNVDWRVLVTVMECEAALKKIPIKNELPGSKKGKKS